MRRTAKAGLVTTMALGLLFTGTGIGQAAPIDCPGGQTATKTATGWDCLNKGGHTSNAEDPKNPNASKGTF